MSDKPIRIVNTIDPGVLLTHNIGSPKGEEIINAAMNKHQPTVYIVSFRSENAERYAKKNGITNWKRVGHIHNMHGRVPDTLVFVGDWWKSDDACQIRGYAVCRNITCVEVKEDGTPVENLDYCKDKLIRKLATLEPTNNGQYYPDDVDQFVKIAKAIVGEMGE